MARGWANQEIKEQGIALHTLHALLKAKDPAGKYGNLVRVMDKQQRFLWVHPQFAGEY